MSHKRYQFKLIEATDAADLEARLKDAGAQQWSAVGYGVLPDGQRSVLLERKVKVRDRHDRHKDRDRARHDDGKHREREDARDAQGHDQEQRAGHASGDEAPLDPAADDHGLPRS
jgi:hypothetical protein